MHEGQRLRSTDRNQVVELIEETLNDGFSYGYLVVENGADVCAIQPYFILDQDLLGGMNGVAKRAASMRCGAFGRASCAPIP